MKLLFSLLFCIVFCASHAQENYLLVRSGGGVAGTATVYKISPDGKVLKGKGLSDVNYTEESRLRKCSVKKYFKGARTVMKSNPDFNYPGNMYAAIVLMDHGQEKKITWGDTSHAAPEDAKKLYEKINTRLSRLTFAPDSRK